METEESIKPPEDLFKDEEFLFPDEPKAHSSSVDPTRKSSEDKKRSPKDIEKWLMDRLKEIIPEDMHSMYINKNNILFAHQTDPLIAEEVEPVDKWLFSLTNGGRRTILSSFDISSPYTKIVNHRIQEARKKVAIDYKTDPSFLRVIDIKSGKYILSNLVRVSAEQRVGLMNYVEYVRSNIKLVPLLEELNRYALMQKIAYKAARKQLWFIMGLAEELKLVERTKSYKYKVLFGKNVNHDQNIYLLDKKVTTKWLHRKREAHIQSSNKVSDTTVSIATYDAIMNSSDIQDSFLRDKIMAADSYNNVLHINSSQSFDGFKSMNISNDAEISDPLVAHAMSISGEGPDGFYQEAMGMSMSNILNVDDSADVTRNPISFKGSVTGNSWQALEQLRRKKAKTATQDVDTVNLALDKIGNRRMNHESKNAINTLMVLEAACKLFGTGPKWSNPDKNEFDASSKKSKLVYVNPPKNVSSKSIAYHYLMQYKSIHQKLNGGIRQQHAVSYGLITLTASKTGEPGGSFKINPQPWEDPLYANKWKKLGGSVGAKSLPWVIKQYQPSRNNKNVENEQASDLIRDEKLDQAPSESDVKRSDETVKETAVVLESDHVVPPNVEGKNNSLGAPILLNDNPLMKLPAEEFSAIVREIPLTDENVITLSEVPTQDSDVTISVEPTALKDADSSTEEEKKDAEEPVTRSDVTGKIMEQSHADSENVGIQGNGVDGLSKNMDENAQVDRGRDAEQPMKIVQGGMKQMKLTELFRYVYTKMKKVKHLPECSPELLGEPQKRSAVMQKRKALQEAPILGKRKRILDDDFIPEAINLNYAPIKSNNEESLRESDEEKEVNEEDNVEVSKEEEPQQEASKISKKEKIYKMREFLKNMFEVEAEESEDENLSDPEDIKKKLQLLKERLQHSDEETESDIESDTEIANEMKDFIGEVEKLNQEDEDLAKQRFFADMQKQEENEIAKLMPLKERSEREMTRREGRMKLLMQLKNNKNLRGIEGLHLSDFESSDEEEGGNGETAKSRRHISKEELQKLLKFRNVDQKSQNLTKTEELQQFVEFKLLNANKQTPCEPVVKNQVETITTDRRSLMDGILFSNPNPVIFGQDKDKPIKSIDPFGAMSTSMNTVAAPVLFGSPKKQATFVMKSFRWDQSAIKPLNSTNIRNVGGFTGFHKQSDALNDKSYRGLLPSRGGTLTNAKP